MENNFQFASAAVSDRGLSDKRPQNEDSYLELRRNGVFAVADGVGGAQAGDVASQMAVEILGEAFANLPNDVDAEDLMKTAIERANAAIYQTSNELPQLASMATTIAALHVCGNIATIGHVGDSRIYRIEPDGTLHRETQDHSVVEEEVLAGRMTPEEALTHPSRNVISRALGAERDVDVDMKTIMVDPGTMFLLCSDGITRHIDDNELTKLFNTEIEPEILCSRMKDICYSRGAEDNLTAVVVRISSGLAGNLAAANIDARVPAEIEEETITTARSPFESTIEESQALEIEEQYPEPEHEIVHNEIDDQAYLLEDAETLYDDEPAAANLESYSSSSVVVPAQRSPGADPQIRETRTFSYDETKSPKSGAVSLLSAIGLLLLGSLLGISSYYFWQRTNPEPVLPVLNEQKSNNTSLTAFEDGRRLVDQDPARYLAAEAASPQIPEDHYLLGRALLLTGKLVEAKRQFMLAREGLNKIDPVNKVDPINAKILPTEIALGFAILNTPGAAESFAKEIAAANQPPNANINGAGSLSAPTR